MIKINEKLQEYAKLHDNCATISKDTAPMLFSYDENTGEYYQITDFACIFDNNFDLIVETSLSDAAKIGEKISIRRYEKMVASDSKLDSYIHMGGKIGVLVEASANISAEVIHDVALQIAAAKPTCVSKEEVPSGDIEKEKEILRAQALNEGKPVAIVDKMVEGRIHKYYKEVCLLEQDFFKDPGKTIKQYQTEVTAKVGEKVAIRRFVRYEMGEGLQKRNDDFAAEVAAQAKKN